MRLPRAQQDLLLQWAAEGLALGEINKRASECDPPFKVDYLQLKHARTKAPKNYVELREQFEEDALQYGLAKRANRLREKTERHSLLKDIIIARGAEMIGEVPGGETGLLVRDYRGKDAITRVYKLDAALLKEMRDLEREIAIELGQWTEKRELTGAGGESLLDPLVTALEKAYGDRKQQPTETDSGSGDGMRSDGS